jgi:hypothetical protein
LTLSDKTPGGFTVSVELCTEPAYVPVIVARVEVPTPVVLIVKFADVLSSGTVTVAGTVAAVRSLDSDTTAPPAGAAELNITIPVDVPPPTSTFGLRIRDVRDGGLTVNVADTDAPL